MEKTTESKIKAIIKFSNNVKNGYLKNENTVNRVNKKKLNELYWNIKKSVDPTFSNTQ